jgi:GH18 family chitinase
MGAKCTGGAASSLDVGGELGNSEYKNIRAMVEAGVCIEIYDDVAQAAYCMTGGDQPTGKYDIWSYDNERSIKYKANQVMLQNLGGLIAWEIHGDNGLLAAVNDVFAGSMAPQPVPAKTIYRCEGCR